MRSRFVLLPDHVLAPKRRALGWRLVGAIVFFFVGAIAATELYPQVVVDHHSKYSGASDSGRAAAPSSAPNAISDRPGTFSRRDSAEYAGRPIPQFTFASTQPPAAAKETQAPADEAQSASVVAVEKPRRTENKSARNKRSSHRHNGNTQDRHYQERPSYLAAGRGWNPGGGSQGGFDFRRR